MLIGTIWIYESPRYLFGMEKFDECKEIISKIAEWNGKKDYEQAIFEEENIMMIENIDEHIDNDRINPSGPVS